MNSILSPLSILSNHSTNELFSGLGKLTTAYGTLGIFEGVACLIGIPIAGAIFDATDSFVIPFYIAAVFFIFASLFGCVAHKIHIEQKQAAAVASQLRT